MQRRTFLASSLLAGVAPLTLRVPALGQGDGPLGTKLALDVPTKLFDGKQCYAHPRVGVVPGAGKDGGPRAVMTLNTVDLVGSDVFRAMHGMTSDDLGTTWSEPRVLEPLAPRFETIDGVKRPVAVSDFWPKWHAASKRLLGTGHTVAYTPEWKVTMPRPRQTTYALYDPIQDAWSPWRKLAMPDDPKFANAGAGCTQRFDLQDGTILLPFYFKPPAGNARVSVLRCQLDKDQLTYQSHGDELSIDDKTRGLGEPSLTRFDGRYFLTIRHDERAYVTSGQDGQKFQPIRPWTFDDGSDLGSYNTQAHWVTHSEGLFLAYTRKGAKNDHIFRHRAPLFLAQVDPDKLHVLRGTEQALIPQRGVRLGNFGVTDVSPDETWVTDSEWMQPAGVEKHGCDGSVYVARIRWSRPNRAAAL